MKKIKPIKKLITTGVLVATMLIYSGPTAQAAPSNSSKKLLIGGAAIVGGFAGKSILGTRKIKKGLEATESLSELVEMYNVFIQSNPNKADKVLIYFNDNYERIIEEKVSRIESGDIRFKEASITFSRIVMDNKMEKFANETYDLAEYLAEYIKDKLAGARDNTDYKKKLGRYQPTIDDIEVVSFETYDTLSEVLDENTYQNAKKQQEANDKKVAARKKANAVAYRKKLKECGLTSSNAGVMNNEKFGNIGEGDSLNFVKDLYGSPTGYKTKDIGNENRYRFTNRDTDTTYDIFVSSNTKKVTDKEKF